MKKIVTLRPVPHPPCGPSVRRSPNNPDPGSDPSLATFLVVDAKTFGDREGGVDSMGVGDLNDAMTPDAFRRHALALPGATFDVKWGSQVYSVGGKMFAACSGETGAFSFKASDMAFDLLVESGVGGPAPYLARAKWVQLADPLQLSRTEVEAYLAQAHRLVAEKLTRRVRTDLGL